MTLVYALLLWCFKPHRILSQPLLKKSAADDLRAAAALVPLLTSICAAFTWQLPAPLQTRAAEVRGRGVGRGGGADSAPGAPVASGACILS
jgi:hypothetical protein